MLYNPGPDGNSGDNYNENPLGKDAPRRRVTGDPRDINGEDR
jgi:hypothetical protein